MTFICYSSARALACSVKYVILSIITLHNRTKLKRVAIGSSKAMLIFAVATDMHGSTDKIKPLMAVAVGGKRAESINRNHKSLFNNSTLNLLDRN